MSIDTMKLRLKYHGGSVQQDRMNADKLKSLKKALLYSYQAATAVLSDGREFRCLINPNKLSLDLDNKILSIPFRGVRVNSTIVPPSTDTPEEELPGADGSINEGVWEDMEDVVAILTLSSEGTWEDMGDIDGSTGDIIEPENPQPEEPEEPFIPIGEEEIGVKEGDIICWKENGSHWIVYLRRLEETAYFRADIRRCRYELTLGNGSKYWAYVRGPAEQNILWTQGGGNYVNKLNYTLSIYVTQNEETLKYFRRFKKIMINGNPWEVQAVDSITTPGIIQMFLKETYNNTIEQNIEKVIEQVTQEPEPEELDTQMPYIYGLNEVYPYDTLEYELKNYSNTGVIWTVQNMSKNKMVKIISEQGQQVKIQIMTGKSGNFTLCCLDASKQPIAAIDIKVKSL